MNPTPIEDALAGSAVKTVWLYEYNPDTSKWVGLVWDKSTDNPDTLTVLEEGKSYWFQHLVDTSIYYQGGYYPLPHPQNSWTKLLWEGGIEFVPGQVITEAWWDFCLNDMKRVGLHTLPWICGARKVEIVPDLPPPYDNDLGATATIWDVDSKILVKDQLLMPSSMFPATILHESTHLWEGRNGYDARENLGYSMNWLFHLLRGDDIDVFSGVPYTGATSVARSTRP